MVLVATFCINVQASGLTAELNVSLNINRLFEQLKEVFRDWGNGKLPTLIGELSSLAGEKRNLSIFLQEYSPDNYEQFEGEYIRQVRGLNKRMDKIDSLIENIDPKWESENPLEKFRLARDAAGKRVFLRFQEENMEKYSANILVLSESYRDESEKILAVAYYLSESLKRHNNVSHPTP